MKLLSLSLIFFLLNDLPSYSQSDAQWLVRNGQGKDGVDATSNNTYSGSLIGTDFTIKGVAHPPRPDDRGGEKNDLFIIYSDWNYYSSRSYNSEFTSANDPFYPRNSGQYFSQTNHNIHLSNNGSIAFMYLTNIYEEDDPPKGAAVIPGLHGENTTSYTVPSNSSTLIMRANHDIVNGKDITLIIPNSTLRNNDVLWFNASVNGKQERATGIYFEPSNIFGIGAQATYSNATCTNNNNGSVTVNSINNQGNYTYINLKPTAVLPGYFGIGSLNNSKITFTIKRAGNSIATLEERIVDSNDPNEVLLVKTCIVDGDTFAMYRINIENNGESVARLKSVSFYTPSRFSADHIAVSSCQFKGEPWPFTISEHRERFEINRQTNSGGSHSGAQTVIQPRLDIRYMERGKVTIRFASGATLNGFSKRSPENARGSISLCLKLHPWNSMVDYPPTIEANDYKLIKPVVKFANADFRITSFSKIQALTVTEIIPSAYGPLEMTWNPSMIFCNCNCAPGGNSCIPLSEPMTIFDHFNQSRNNR